MTRRVLSVRHVGTMHAGGMSKHTPTHLAIVGRSATGQPRTYRVQGARPSASRAAAYRRLAIRMLGLDVPTLMHDLRTARLGQRQHLAA